MMLSRDKSIGAQFMQTQDSGISQAYDKSLVHLRFTSRSGTIIAATLNLTLWSHICTMVDQAVDCRVKYVGTFVDAYAPA